jgi:hypothetical protein
MHGSSKNSLTFLRNILKSWIFLLFCDLLNQFCPTALWRPRLQSWTRWIGAIRASDGWPSYCCLAACTMKSCVWRRQIDLDFRVKKWLRHSSDFQKTNCSRGAGQKKQFLKKIQPQLPLFGRLFRDVVGVVTSRNESFWPFSIFVDSSQEKKPL